MPRVEGCDDLLLTGVSHFYLALGGHNTEMWSVMLRHRLR
jgi:hypothetical protein